jgi:hypothetical protein
MGQKDAKLKTLAHEYGEARRELDEEQTQMEALVEDHGETRQVSDEERIARLEHEAAERLKSVQNERLDRD